MLVVLFAWIGGCSFTNSTSDPKPDGRELFAVNCANCHGMYADGQGSASTSLSMRMTDLRYLSARNNGTFPQDFVQTIVDGRSTRAAHGPASMPVWGDVFSLQEGDGKPAQARVQAKIDSLTRYLEDIQKQ